MNENDSPSSIYDRDYNFPIKMINIYLDSTLKA